MNIILLIIVLTVSGKNQSATEVGVQPLKGTIAMCEQDAVAIKKQMEKAEKPPGVTMSIKTECLEVTINAK